MAARESSSGPALVDSDQVATDVKTMLCTTVAAVPVGYVAPGDSEWAVTVGRESPSEPGAHIAVPTVVPEG